MSLKEEDSSSRQTRMSSRIMASQQLASYSQQTHESLEVDEQYNAVEKMLQKAKALASDLNNKVLTHLSRSVAI